MCTYVSHFILFFFCCRKAISCFCLSVIRGIIPVFDFFLPIYILYSRLRFPSAILHGRFNKTFSRLFFLHFM